MLHALAEKGITRLMVEGGPTVAIEAHAVVLLKPAKKAEKAGPKKKR